VLAVAVTGLLLLVWGLPPGVEGRETTELTEPAMSLLPTDPGAAMDQAANTMRELAVGFYAFMPRILLVLALLALAALIARGVQWILNRSLRGWERKEAAGALARLVVFLSAAVAAVSVLAGDVRAVVGSVGLFGLAASWALQTPIESFTGWLLNSFRGYYRVGDRIAVGEVFGDVYRIDVLTTTVWEAGGPGKPVRAAQSTGALITFPNWEVLRSNIVNYSRDFPYVWDEVEFNVANESDLAYTASVIQDTARRVLGPQMEQAAHEYQALLDAQHIPIEQRSRRHCACRSSSTPPPTASTRRSRWRPCTARRNRLAPRGGRTDHAKRLGHRPPQLPGVCLRRASTLLAMNAAYAARRRLTRGGFFDVPREAALDLQRRARRSTATSSSSTCRGTS
jgi:small conductance mechanosensitive channel